MHALAASPQSTGLSSLNAGDARVFPPGRPSVGRTVPVASDASSDGRGEEDVLGVADRVPSAEQAGFAAVWLLDLPFGMPWLGDAGHVTDPWVTPGLLAGQSARIALGVASLVLSVLRVAPGDRPAEYSAMGASFADGGARVPASSLLPHFPTVSDVPA